MSYPGYPPYPQAPGQQNPQIPPAYQATAPLSYPVYPGSAAPQPYGMYGPGACPYPTSPYPPQAPGYPPAPSQQMYPPSSTPQYPTSGYPPSSAYPPSQQSSMYPTQGSCPTSSTQPYPPSSSSPYDPCSQPLGSSAYPGVNSSSHGGSHVPFPGAVPVFPSSGASCGAYPATATATAAHTVQSSQLYSHNKGQPTLRPAHPFDPRADGEILRKAMKGFGTDEKAIIQVLTKRTNNQRQEIAIQFKTLYGKDLISDLKGETSGKFEQLLVALMTPVPEFLAHELHHAMSGIGTNEETLVEILCTATNADIRYIRSAYERLYYSSLEKDLMGDTSGNFKRLLVSLCQGGRSENYAVDFTSATHDAQTLLRAGELRLGTDESAFNAILCSRSYPQLAQIFMEYQKLTGHDFEKVVQKEFSGDIEKGLLAIVRSVRNRSGFFADRLYEAMSGAGTNDRALIRLVATRCEIDMMDIKQAFQSKYGKSLEDFISGDSSGDYKKALLSLIS